MKAICDVHFKSLSGVFDVGDVVEIEPVLGKERVVISQKAIRTTSFDRSGKKYVSVRYEADQVREVGDYIGFRIKSKNGKYYTGACFINCIGYVPLSGIFSKFES